MYLPLEKKLWPSERRHIISNHRQASDVDVYGCNTVSDYAAAVRHVSCIYCGECGRVSLCVSTLCICVLLSLFKCLWVSVRLNVYHHRCFIFWFYTYFIRIYWFSLLPCSRRLCCRKRKKRSICKQWHFPYCYLICQYDSNIFFSTSWMCVTRG